MKRLAIIACFAACFISSSAFAAPETVTTKTFVADVTRFLQAEMGAHVAAVQTLDPPQPQVLGVPTKGDFTWGSFLRALSDVAALSPERTLGGRDIPRLLGQLGLIEAALGGKTFAQLGGALALKQWGIHLDKNAIWQTLSPDERKAWRSLLDPGRFYDRQKKIVINLPENYFGVAARIASIDWQLGLEPDRAFADDLLTRAAGQFLHGALYTDDNQPTGRYDRYSQEYARFVLDAATNLGRKDVLAAVEPALKAVMKTWWDLVSPDGYGYPWGRTIGAISYMDSMEIVGFLAEHPQYRPAPLRDLAGVYVQAWRWLQQDYKRDRHLLDMFGFGRGNYAYMTPERQWQQTTSFLGKTADSLRKLGAALNVEHVATFPAHPTLPPVERFEWFRHGDRPAGVWLVRQPGIHFALPFSTGPHAAVADYLPVPHALPGFAVPVEQAAPALVTHIEIDDKTFVAADCADEIVPERDGRAVVARWRRYAIAGGEPGPLAEPGLTTQVQWKLDGHTLTRDETITATRPLALGRLSLSVPTTGNRASVDMTGGRRLDRFDDASGGLEASVGELTRASGGKSTVIPVRLTVEATGNGPLGRGARGPIPLVLRAETGRVQLGQGDALHWIVRVTPTTPTSP